MKPHITQNHFERVRNCPDICMIMDAELHFLIISEGAEKEWKKTQQEVEGVQLLDVFPDLIASRNYRNMIHALSGQTINDVIEGRSGKIYRILYQPLFSDNQVSGLEILAVSNGRL